MMRVEVLHGVNLDMLGRRDPGLYGTLTLVELQQRIAADATELGVEVAFFQTNAEHELIARMHTLGERADAAIVNAGAWTHYAWSLRDALEIAQLPFVEVHLSDVRNREPWRAVSVFEGLPTRRGEISGRGPAGYRDALEVLCR